MFDLADVFELIVDSFYEASLPQHQLIAHAHELVLHVVVYGGDELNALTEKLAGEHFSELIDDKVKLEAVEPALGSSGVLSICSCKCLRSLKPSSEKLFGVSGTISLEVVFIWDMAAKIFV